MFGKLARILAEILESFWHILFAFFAQEASRIRCSKLAELFLPLAKRNILSLVNDRIAIMVEPLKVNRQF